MGSNKMLQVALGKTEADEYRTNLHLLSERLRGHVGLFFTSLPHDEVRPRRPRARADWGGQRWRGRLRGRWGIACRALGLPSRRQAPASPPVPRPPPALLPPRSSPYPPPPPRSRPQTGGQSV
jgi:hypothetical protein